MTDPRLPTRATWDGLATGASPIVKLVATAEDLPIDTFTELVASLVGDRVTVTHSSPSDSRGMVEISAAGVTKATTLALVCDRLGVDPRAVAAFGDMPNDEAMLEFAGRGFAMGNAHPLLRSRFRVAPSNREGGVGVTVRALLSRTGELGVPEIVQAVIVDAEVVRDLMHHRNPDLLDDFVPGLAQAQGGVLEDHDPVG